LGADDFGRFFIGQKVITAVEKLLLSKQTSAKFKFFVVRLLAQIFSGLVPDKKNKISVLISENR